MNAAGVCMLIGLLTASFGVGAAGSASAEPPPPPEQGHYAVHRDGVSRSVRWHTASNGKVSGELEVVARGCVGSLVGEGSWAVSGGLRLLRLTPSEKDPDLEAIFGTCWVSLTLGADGRRITVSEDRCMAWHGASCDFEAVLDRR